MSDFFFFFFFFFFLAHYWLLVLELSAPESPMDFGNCFPDDSDFSFDLIFIRFAYTENSFKILDVFELGSGHMKVTCHLVSVRHLSGRSLSEW